MANPTSLVPQFLSTSSLASAAKGVISTGASFAGYAVKGLPGVVAIGCFAEILINTTLRVQAVYEAPKLTKAMRTVDNGDSTQIAQLPADLNTHAKCHSRIRMSALYAGHRHFKPSTKEKIWDAIQFPLKFVLLTCSVARVATQLDFSPEVAASLVLGTTVLGLLADNTQRYCNASILHTLKTDYSHIVTQRPNIQA